MHSSEEIVTRFRHPIIKNRIVLLSGCVKSNKYLFSPLSNLIDGGSEIIPDLDGFNYKIYFENNTIPSSNTYDTYFENACNNSININRTNISFKEETIFIIKVYHRNIKAFWNCGFQLIQHYKSILNMEIDLLENNEQEHIDCIKIKVSKGLASKIYCGYPRILKTPAYYAFEMLTSAIRTSLYCANVLNTLRYVSYTWNDLLISEYSSSKINCYKLADISLLSSKKLHVYYTSSLNNNPSILIALELCNPLISEVILTKNFLQEFSIAINQFDHSVEKRDNEKLMFFFSKCIPEDIEKIELITSVDDNEKKSFLMITVPVSWLHSTNDSRKLFLAALISTTSDMLYQIIPQCKCLLRCGLRKNILELTSQESKGY